MNADVEKAVEVMRERWPGYGEAKAVIEQALRGQEAEIARLRLIEQERWSVVATRNAAIERAEKAEALLRECLSFASEMHVMEIGWTIAESQRINARITAHLGAEQ